MTNDATPPDSRGDRARRGGLGHWIRTHTAAATALGAVIAVVVLGGGAFAAGAATGRHSAATAPVASAVPVAPSATSTAPRSSAPTPTPTVAARSVPTSIPAASPLRTCTVDTAAAAAALGTFEGTVVDASTGATLFDRNGSTPARTGSVMKALTSAVALADLGVNYKFTTKVTGDVKTGSIALVGGGDPTLSALPAGQESVYKGAPKIATLAADVKAKLGTTTLKTVALDSSMWNNADAYDPTWPVTERTIGYQPLIVPLMVDGDRADPTQATSPRSTDPVGHAGDAFRAALAAAGVNGAATATFTRSNSTSSTVLGQVQSQPISTLIGQMIPNSDNTLAEMMARVSSKVSGADGSASSLTAVYKAALSKAYGLDASNITIIDGSGESYNDAVSPALVAQLMIKVQNKVGSLVVLDDALPISGQTGTLAGRFTGANAVARGHVFAKTGSIATAYTLGGIIDAADGTVLTFAFYAIGNSVSAASSIPALDTLTAAVYSCGGNLSNN